MVEKVKVGGQRKCEDLLVRSDTLSDMVLAILAREVTAAVQHG